MRIILFLLTLLIAAETSFAKIEAVLGSVPLAENSNLLGLPRTKTNEVIISREDYVISYNKERRSPNWVAWKVDAQSLGPAKRLNKFEQDEELQKYLKQDTKAPPAVTPDDYRQSCFDRGHQVPSADRTSSSQSNQATFVMSNMLPQTPYLNRYLWEQFEHHTRELVAEGKTVYAIAGPVYDQDFGAIGPNNDIPVPSKIFKVLIVKEGDKFRTLSVLMPNVLKTGEAPTNKETLCQDSASPNRTAEPEWHKYRRSLADIQKLSGIKLAR